MRSHYDNLELDDIKFKFLVLNLSGLWEPITSNNESKIRCPRVIWFLKMLQKSLN